MNLLLRQRSSGPGTANIKLQQVQTGAEAVRKDSVHSDRFVLGNECGRKLEDLEGGRRKSKSFDDIGITKWQKGKILIASFLTNFLCLGITQAYGIFQVYYGSEAAVGDGILRPRQRKNKAEIALIGSFSTGGPIAAFGIVFVPFLPQIGRKIKHVCAIGTFFMVLGLATSVVSNDLGMLVGTQGLLFGSGSGLVTYTLLPILAEYYTTHSGLAQGCVGAAGGAGGLFFSKLLSHLFTTYHARTTLAILVAIVLTTGLVIILCAQPALKPPPSPNTNRNTATKPHRPHRPHRPRYTIPLTTFLNPTFTLFALTNLLLPLTIRTPQTFGPLFTQTLNPNLSPTTLAQKASNTSALLSAVGIPSRLLLGLLSDTLGHQNALLSATLILALSIFALWLPATQTENETLWMVFLVFWGVVNGAFQQLVNSVGKGLFGDEVYYLYNGVFTSMRGVGYTLGAPVAGMLVEQRSGVVETTKEFLGVVMCTGGLLAICVVTLGMVRWLDVRKRGWAWVR